MLGAPSSLGQLASLHYSCKWWSHLTLSNLCIFIIQALVEGCLHVFIMARPSQQNQCLIIVTASVCSRRILDVMLVNKYYYWISWKTNSWWQKRETVPEMCQWYLLSFFTDKESILWAQFMCCETHYMIKLYFESSHELDWFRCYTYTRVSAVFSAGCLSVLG